MPTQLKLEDVEAQIIAALQADAEIISLNPQIAGLSSKDFNEQGEIIVNPPAVLVLFEVATDDPRSDLTRLTYNTATDWILFCGAQDLSSVDNERNAAYTLVSAVRAALAGKRFTIDGRTLAGVTLNGVQPEQFDQNGIWYSVRIRVGDTTQFG